MHYFSHEYFPPSATSGDTHGHCSQRRFQNRLLPRIQPHSSQHHYTVHTTNLTQTQSSRRNWPLSHEDVDKTQKNGRRLFSVNQAPAKSKLKVLARSSWVCCDRQVGSLCEFPPCAPRVRDDFVSMHRQSSDNFPCCSMLYHSFYSLTNCS